MQPSPTLRDLTPTAASVAQPRRGEGGAAAVCGYLATNEDAPQLVELVSAFSLLSGSVLTLLGPR
jgi:hypothetical protein